MAEGETMSGEFGAGSVAIEEAPVPADPGVVDDTPIDENDLQALLDSPAHNFRSLTRGDVVEGQVVRIDSDEILVDIGLKAEGVVAGRERGSEEDLSALTLGDTVLVYVMQPEGSEGQIVLSLRRAKMEKSWRVADGILERNEIIEAEVVDHNKGGLIVNVFGLRGFVPISQVLNLRREPGERTESSEDELSRRLSEMVGRHLQLEIIELNRNRNRLILSERAAAQKVRQQRKDELLNELQVGQVRKGRVSNLCNFGAFVDLGGADGLIHISQLSWGHLNHPNQVLKVGEEVDVYVLGIDPIKKKIALSLKRAQADPWDTVDDRYQVGQLVNGTVTKITSFGAFARVEDGIEGLAHVSELASRHVANPKEIVQEGETYEFKVIHIDGRKRRMGLSLRAMEDEAALVEGDDNPWAAAREAVSSSQATTDETVESGDAVVAAETTDAVETAESQIETPVETADTEVATPVVTAESALVEAVSQVDSPEDAKAPTVDPAVHVDPPVAAEEPKTKEETREA